MFVLNLSGLFQNEADLKARSAIRNFISTQNLENLNRFKKAWREREEKASVTNYSSHILDRAIMYAQAKKDFTDIEERVGGYNDLRLVMYHNTLHQAYKASMTSVHNSALQFLQAEKIKKRENNPLFKLIRKIT